MSQEKVERYKQKKANRKKEVKITRIKRLTGKIAAWVILVAAIGGIGYGIYNHVQDSKPMEVHYCNTSPIDMYMMGLSYQ